MPAVPFGNVRNPDPIQVGGHREASDPYCGGSEKKHNWNGGMARAVQHSAGGEVAVAVFRFENVVCFPTTEMSLAAPAGLSTSRSVDQRR